MRIKSLLFVTLYYLILLLSYVYTVSPNFSYMGYINNSPSYFLIVLSAIFAIFPSLFLSISITRASEIVCWVLYLFVAIPSSFIPLFTLNRDPLSLILLEIVIMFNILLLNLMFRIPLIKIKRIKINNNNFWFLIIALSGLFYFYIFYKFGFKFHFSGLSEAYEIRFSYREESDKLAKYFINWQTKVINPLLIAIGLFRKKLSLIAIGIIGQVILFSISGHKAYLFSPILIFGLWFSLKNNGTRFGLRFSFSLFGMILLTFLVDILLNSSELTSMFVRRMIITPALLTGYYYDFFLNNPFVVWGHSFLSGIINYPYTLNPPFLIGGYYFGNTNVAANANILADGFANLGFIGMFFNTFILGMVLLIYDSISVNLDKSLMGMFLAVSAWNLADTALFTTILTHGVFLVLIIVFLLPQEIGMLNSLDTHKKSNRSFSRYTWNL